MRCAADEAITRALAAVGLQRGVDRAFYYELDETARTAGADPRMAHPRNPGDEGRASGFAIMSLDVLPEPFLASLRRGGLVRIPRTDQFLGRWWRPGRPDGDRALVLTPVVVDGVLIGIAGFAAVVGSTWEQATWTCCSWWRRGSRARWNEARRRCARRREDRFRAKCDASPLGIFLASRGRRLDHLNPAGER